MVEEDGTELGGDWVQIHKDEETGEEVLRVD